MYVCIDRYVQWQKYETFDSKKHGKCFTPQVKTSLKFPMPETQDRDTMEC